MSSEAKKLAQDMEAMSLANKAAPNQTEKTPKKKILLTDFTIQRTLGTGTESFIG